MHPGPIGFGRALGRFGPLVLRVAAGVTVLWLLVRLLGAAPFENGLRAVTWPAVTAAVTLTALTTACSAWRWRVVARALGIGIGLPSAMGAYYRSLFLNSVLIGGMVGDVHRAVTHGRRAGDVGRGLRAVAWERLWGQVIQAMVTAVVLLTLRSPVRPAAPFVLAGVAGAAGCAALVVRGAARRGRSRPARTARAAADDLRRQLLAPDVCPRLVLASVLVVAGHTTTFVIAARVAGCAAPLGELVALLMIVQTAGVIPLAIGGWGPREGAAAWVFAAAGLGAGTGVTIATLYAVLMLAAVAPGAGLLLRDTVHGGGRPGHPDDGRAPGPVLGRRSAAVADRVLSRTAPFLSGRRSPRVEPSPAFFRARYVGSTAGVPDRPGGWRMTIRTESRLTIACSADDLWAYVCDVGRWPEWAPTVLECWVRGGGPLQPGSRVEQRARDLWRTHGRSQEVTAIEAPRSLAFAGTMGSSVARWGMEFWPADDGQTDATMWIEVEPAGFMRVAPALFRGSIQRVSDREMVAIKAAVESAARDGARRE